MLTLIFWIAVACVVWYLVARFLPGPAGFKYVIYILLSVWVLFMVLSAFGVSIGPPPSSGHMRAG